MALELLKIDQNSFHLIIITVEFTNPLALGDCRILSVYHCCMFYFPGRRLIPTADQVNWLMGWLCFHGDIGCGSDFAYSAGKPQLSIKHWQTPLTELFWKMSDYWIVSTLVTSYTDPKWKLLHFYNTNIFKTIFNQFSSNCLLKITHKMATIGLKVCHLSCIKGKITH